MIVTIKKNRHTYFKCLRFIFTNEINLKFKLIGDFTYKTEFEENQKDTNKIFGLSDSYFHRINSIRIGFRYINNNLELLSYYYNNGQHYSEKIANIESNIEYNINIKILKKNYLIEFNSEKFYYNRTSNWNFIRYLLFPYFGGNETTKKDLKFYLNYKNK
jgi:hypothetical protein